MINFEALLFVCPKFFHASVPTFFSKFPRFLGPSAYVTTSELFPNHFPDWITPKAPLGISSEIFLFFLGPSLFRGSGWSCLPLSRIYFTFTFVVLLFLLSPFGLVPASLPPFVPCSTQLPLPSIEFLAIGRGTSTVLLKREMRTVETVASF